MWSRATSPSLEQGSLPQLVRYPFKELKAKETRKKGKMIAIKNVMIGGGSGGVEQPFHSKAAPAVPTKQATYNGTFLGIAKESYFSFQASCSSSPV